MKIMLVNDIFFTQKRMITLLPNVTQPSRLNNLHKQDACDTFIKKCKHQIDQMLYIKDGEIKNVDSFKL